MQEAIKPQQIASIRGQIKIGDIIMVQTQKGNHKTCGNGKTGVAGRNCDWHLLQFRPCEIAEWRM